MNSVKSFVRIFGLISFVITSVTALAANSANSPTDVSLQSVKTFDGQAMSCQQRYDAGRMAYRVKSAAGVIRAGQLEVTVNFETLKCVERAGVLGFENAGLAGRLANPLGGFIEFQNIDLVGYTPDFKVVLKRPASLLIGDQTVQFVAPVGKFAGLLPRNANSNGGRKVVMIVFLGGVANLGVAKTGQVLDHDTVAFGAYNLLLSEAEGTLTFAR
ncbi:hypothetical protein BH10BDE1_BH10BDE1_25490 [soil metagenome]